MESEVEASNTTILLSGPEGQILSRLHTSPHPKQLLLST